MTMPTIRLKERTKRLLDAMIEKEIRREAKDPRVFLSALRSGTYGYSHDDFIMKMLKERNKS